MADPLTENSESSPPRETSPTNLRTQRKWVPVAILTSVTLFWAWLRQSDFTDDFRNVFMAIAVIATAIALSIWFLRNGGYAKPVRRRIVAVPWLGALVLLFLFRPVMTGDLGIVGWKFRFASSHDEKLAPITANEQPAEWEPSPYDYPRFLGNGYWAEVPGIEIETDWRSHPPVEVWRREIGAGWSSFAVAGNFAITQEQRGPEEVVSCYRVDNGDIVWVHRDTARFDPAGPNSAFAGPGPRATPTIADAKVLTQGATGIVNCLDARTGDVIWRHDTAGELDVDLPQWGKSGSPLVTQGLVIISAGAPRDRSARDTANSSLVAYDLASGELRWRAGSRPPSYASPIAVTLAGEPQIVVVNEKFVTSHRRAGGEILWEHPWADENDSSESASQPVPVGDDRLFLSKGYGVGASLIEIARDSSGRFSVRPLWEPPIKPVMKTKMGNIVLRDGFVYGLDGVLLQCIELETGRVAWKKRRRPSFGHGQLLLVGDAILLLTEGGELVAIEATPDRYHELAAIQALDEKNVTWNNPAFAPPFLLVRNGREAACYRMPIRSGLEERLTPSADVQATNPPE